MSKKVTQYPSKEKPVIRFYNDYYIFDKIRDNGWYYDYDWIQDVNAIRNYTKEFEDFNKHPVSTNVDRQLQLELEFKTKHGNMNKESKERLKTAELAYLITKYPSVPIPMIPLTKYEDKTANGLTKCIVEFLNYSKCQAERISTTGLFRNGKWTKGSGTKGSADISATIQGRSVKIEVKIGKDRQSEDQKKYQRSIEDCGGVYIIAKNFDDFVVWYDNFCIFVNK
jgi:hypothetical protein